MLRRLSIVLVLAVALGACSTAAGGSVTGVGEPELQAAATTAAPPVASQRPGRVLIEADRPEPPVWIVGAELMPLRPDGLAEILPTPAVLVDRNLPTISALPSPTGHEFESQIVEIDASIRARMGRTWVSGCPVPLDDLRYVNVSFWGFDGELHTGELVVHGDVADDVVWVFSRLHEARFPIEEMRLITDADLDAPATGDGNNSAAFICRPMRGGSSWSEHAMGRAVDINPFHNPYVRGDIVLPERASAYLDRSWHRPGMVQSGDVVTEAFAAIGWGWGGNWSSPDYMHFSASGR